MHSFSEKLSEFAMNQEESQASLNSLEQRRAIFLAHGRKVCQKVIIGIQSEK